MPGQLGSDPVSESFSLRARVGFGSNKVKAHKGSFGYPTKVVWLPAQYETMRVTRTVRRGVAEVKMLLRVGPERVIALAYGNQSDTSGGGVVIGLGSGGWMKIPVHVESLTPSPDHHDTVISLRWQATRATRYFPVMEGDLKAQPGNDDTTLLVLEGRYRPPLGLLGLIFDQILGRRIASTTAARFVERIAHEIEQSDVIKTGTGRDDRNIPPFSG